MTKYSSEEEIQDDDPTDELPILTDVMLGEEAQRMAATPGPVVEAEDTAQFRTASEEALESAAARLQQDLDSRNERLSTLEDELTRLQQRWSETEAVLSERDTELSHLRVELADREAAIREQRTVLEQTTEALHKRETIIAEQTAALESERTRAEALERSSLDLEQQIKTLQHKLGEIETEHATARAQPVATVDDAVVTRLRGDIAALSQHIENRNSIWHDQAATLLAQSTRIRELEIEVAQRLERQLAAEQYAETEVASAHSARERLGQALTALRQEKSTAEYRSAVQEAKPAPTEEEDRAAQLRRELARTVLLQSEQGDDSGTLRRLSELEAAIVGLENQIDGPGAAPEPKLEPAPVPAKLICLTDDELAEFTLDKETVTIGRGATCDIRIGTHYVSREHARITITATDCFIEDLSSRNGVFVNAVKIERENLQANDLITVGDTQFRYQSGEGE